jgi:hypothetical protein
MKTLKAISDAMDALGINYAFGEYVLEKSEESEEVKPKYPYFVGEYQERENMNEDGMTEKQFILTGFARGKGAIAELESTKEKIKKYFPQVGGRLTTVDGSAVVIYYASAFGNLPTGDASLKKIQINLNTKEWSE